MNRQPEQLSEHVWRVPLLGETLPPHDHTNTYVVQSGSVATIIDPGSEHDSEIERLYDFVRERGVSLVKNILLTHTHPDHVAGLQRAWEVFDEPTVYVHPAEAERLSGPWRVAYLDEGRRLANANAVVQVWHTPGHSPGSLSFLVLNEAGKLESLIAGDLITETGSVWVGHPEGDVSVYLQSLQRVRQFSPPIIGPGHGAGVVNVRERVNELIAHKEDREQQILRAIGADHVTLSELTRRVYPDVPATVQVHAQTSILAHVLKLMRELQVVHLGDTETGPYAVRR